MFTRAAKSVVKNLGQRKYYGGEDNLKVTVIGAAGEVGQTLSHFVKNAGKLETPVIRDCKPSSRLLMLTAEQSRSSGTSKTLKVQDPRTESFPQKSQQHNSSSFVSCFANRELDLERTVTELREKEIKLWPGCGIKKQTETTNERPATSFPLSKTKTTGLIGVLGRVPATSADWAASQSRQVGQTSSYTPITTQSDNVGLRISRYRKPRITSEATTIAETLRLGDSDCGEGPPDRPEKGPCHPPDGPCVPMKKPGYPARPRSARKDFCVKCPPKRPCNLNKCPPDSEGTCGKADLQRRDLLKLISESQATFSVMRSNLSRSSIRYFIESTRKLHHLGINDHATWLRGVQRRCFSDCSGKPPDKPSPCSKSPRAEPECKPPKKTSTKSPQERKEPEAESKSEKKCADVPKSSEPESPPIALKCKETEREPKVLYRKCPPLPKLPKLPKCPKPPEPKAQEPCPKISAPKCPPPPSLPKCPECPKVATKETVKTETEKPTVKCFQQPEKSAEKPSSSADCPEDDSHGGATKAKGDSGKKKKSLWEKITTCGKRKMSTCLPSSKISINIHSSRMESQRRSLGTSEVVSSSFPSNDGAPPSMPPWKRGKCKTIEEVCGEEIDPKLKALECEPTNCPKNPHAACYPEKPRCGEVRKPVHRKEDQDRMFAGGKRDVGVSGKKMDDCMPPTVPKAAIEKIDYSKVGCEPPKLTKLGPCPAPPKSFDKADHCDTSENMVKTVPAPLPKPPSAPAVLCPCPPPPKMHPGSCPCYAEAQDSEIKPLTEPCPSKPKHPCSESRIYYCPPSKATCDQKKEFDDKKNPTKP